MFAHTYDKSANSALGTVDYGLTATQSVVYIDAGFSGSYGDSKNFAFTNPTGACSATTAFFGINAFATIPDGMMHVQSGGAVCVAKGSYSDSVTLAGNPVQIIGDGNTASDTVVTGPITISVSGADSLNPLLLQNLRVSNSAGHGVSVGTGSHLAFDHVAFVGNGSAGLNLNGVSDDVVITDSLFDGNTGAGLRTASTAQVSNVSITGSTFSNNAVGIILFGASGSGNGQISNWTIDSSQFLSNANNDTNNYGAGIWIKTAGAGSAINGFSVTGSTFADNGSSNTLNQVGITVRARPNTTMAGVSICDDTFSDTATPGTQLTGINVFDETSTGGSYQPIVVCGTTTVNNLQDGISGLEQFTLHGTKPVVNITGPINVTGGGMRWNYIQLAVARSAVYVDDNFASNGNGDAVTFTHPQLNGGVPVNAVYGDNAFATISAALDRVDSGGTIYVAAGIYPETSGAGESLTISKPVTILGEQAGIDARTRADTNASVIVPGTAQAGLTLSSYQTPVVDVHSDDVTIDGFIVDADNPALTSSVDLNGADPDVAGGIYETGNNITLQNLVIRNAIFAGVAGDGPGGTGGNGGNVITRNRLTNITSPSAWGLGVLLETSFYADVTDNLMDEVRVGVQVDSENRAAPGGFMPSISGNVIHAARTGVFYNQLENVAPAFTISDNQFFAVNNSAQAGQWQGIWVETLDNAQTVVISGNTIDASALASSSRMSVGYLLNNIKSSAASTTSINGGSVSHADVGVLSTDATFYTGLVNDYLVTNVAFADIRIAAFYVEDTAEKAGTAKLTIGDGNTFTDVAHTLALAGTDPQVGFAGSQTGVADVLVRAAGVFFNTNPATGNVTYHTANASINYGIALANAGGTVDVEAGTFDENVVVNKSVTLKGPFAGIAGDDGCAG